MPVVTNPERTWDETGPKLVQFDYTQCFHVIIHKVGFTPKGRQQLICKFCRQTWVVDPSRLNLLEEIRAVAPLYKKGKTLEEAIQISGLKRFVVKDLYTWFSRRWPRPGLISSANVL